MKKVNWLIPFVILLILASCKKEEDNTPPAATGGYEYTVGSTTYRIPDTAVNFARQNFSRDAQLLREFQVATNTDGQWVSPAWGLGLGIWKLETYDVRSQYMTSPYNNDVNTSDSAQFYYQIGNLLGQFGYGWKDTFDAANFNPDSAYTAHIWPSDAIETVGFDGQSPFAVQYRGMWITE
jgi:hypothetical protein